MKFRSLKPEDVQRLCEQYTYVLAYEVSQMYFGTVTDVGPKIHWSELLEARFFDQSGEIHLYDDGDGQKAYEVTDQDNQNVKTEDVDYDLADKFRKLGKRVQVREYLDYDSDGQAVVCCKRLADVR